MLELLAAKGPVPPPPPTHQQKQKRPSNAHPLEQKRDRRVVIDRDSGQITLTENNAAMTATTMKMGTTTMMSASQETDYDCGEEWDDDDLLCDML
ncbi:hypothetical protein RRF57_011691 [Xylaria bambusicola]|uniref:Uncharacterized protein n=1 Tax=Xylaria bambusicola TaxID=326684 RepID=A0AAN7UX33_9PEZI